MNKAGGGKIAPGAAEMAVIPAGGKGNFIRSHKPQMAEPAPVEREQALAAETQLAHELTLLAKMNANLKKNKLEMFQLCRERMRKHGRVPLSKAKRHSTRGSSHSGSPRRASQEHNWADDITGMGSASTKDMQSSMGAEKNQTISLLDEKLLAQDTTTAAATLQPRSVHEEKRMQ